MKNIMDIFRMWRRIKHPPNWVRKAYIRWEGRLPTHPYNMIKEFTGENFIYKVKHGMGAQGEAPIIGWYKKTRGRAKE